MKRVLRFFKAKDLFFYLSQRKGALLSGVLIGTSYIPFPPWALFVCLIPLWAEVLKNRESFWKSFFRGWWTQFILSLIGFNWIAYVSHEFGYMPWPFAILTLLFFAATVHLYFAIAVGSAQWLRNRFNLSAWVTIFLMAALTGFGEIYWPSLFPWNFGYTFLWINSPIAQTADVLGFQGLSLLVLFANAGLAWAYLQARNARQYKFLIAKGFALLAILSFLHFWGIQKKSEWQNPSASLKVLQVQANIGNFEKYMAEKGNGFEQLIANQYFDLTRQGLQKYPDTELIIWPESAFPDYLDENLARSRVYSRQFVAFVDEIKKPIITGGFSEAFDKNGKMNSYNAFFLYGNNGHNTQPPYHKTDLLMFGEYTPLTDQFPWLATISPAGIGFARGNGPQVMPFQNIQLGPQICYESLYPEFSAKLVNLGADILINLTNDSWFGPTAEPYQHMIMTLARGLEVRRPLIRNTNTGITTAILADGRQLQRSPTFQAWFGQYEIHYQANAEITFFARYHHFLPLLLFILTAIIISIDFQLRRRSKRART